MFAVVVRVCRHYGRFDPVSRMFRDAGIGAIARSCLLSHYQTLLPSASATCCWHTRIAPEEFGGAVIGSGSITGIVSTEDIGNPLKPVYTKIRLSNHLTFENYVSSGVVEVPELVNPLHVLILRTGSPSIFEWRSNGRDHRAELPPGSVSLFPTGLRQAARVFRPHPGTTSILQIQPRFFDRSIGELAKGGKVELIRRSGLNDTQIARLMESLRADIAAGSPSGSLFAESVAVALSAHIAQQYSTLTTPPERYRGGLSRFRLNRVLEYINANLGDNLELNMLAEVAGVNMYHFARAFKQSTGETPHQHVLRRRIERAKEFLRDPRFSVIEASARTGFVDQSHFSKVFRRIVGIAPSEFRNNI